MRLSAFALVAVSAVTGGGATMAPAFGHADGKSAENFVTTIPPGYRDWKLISVGREEGSFPCHAAIKSRDFVFTRYAP